MRFAIDDVSLDFSSEYSEQILEIEEYARGSELNSCLDVYLYNLKWNLMT